jgi:NAD-dependent SIR2 family protein deacetylase
MPKGAKSKANTKLNLSTGKTAIFLGAGASTAEGAPLQKDLFKAYFGSDSIDRRSTIYKRVSNFFHEIFDVDWSKPINAIKFPTFEEALGILDLSEMRRESFRAFEDSGALPDMKQVQSIQGNSSAEPQLIRLYLILIMAKAINDGLRKKEKRQFPHQKLINNLETKRLLNKTIFVSTNYDLLIDLALQWQIDYGVEFSGAHKFGSLRAVENAVPIFKLHGSLNWLYCPVCNNLNSWESKAVLSLMKPDRPITRCGFCASVMSPVIVPPTFYKDMSRVFLSSIWNRAENALREVDHVIFCGYSCPDADKHVKYLLKRMQTNRSKSDKVKFTLINHHFEPTVKSEEQAANEAERFKRFFGDRVNDTRKSFQDFAEAPERFY